MMHELEAPHHFAGLCRQRDDGIRPFVVARPLEAVIVGAGTRGRHKDEVAPNVDGDCRPGIARTGRREACRDWVPAPAKSAGARVKCSDEPARAVDAIVVRDPRADDDEVIHDRRRRGFLILAAAGDVDDAASQVDLSGGAEIGAGPTGCGIECEEARIDCRQKGSPAAGIAFGSAGIGPQCYAAIDEAFGVGSVQVDLRIEAPLLPAGLGVERDDPIERRAQIHGIFGDDRGRLERALAAAVAAVETSPVWYSQITFNSATLHLSIWVSGE